MEPLIDEKIQIGISACQFGAPVRYNGKGLDSTRFIGRERGDFVWHPVCPEAMSGLGVPRSPVSLRGGNGDDFWKGTASLKTRGGRDVGSEMKAGCAACLDTLVRGGVKVFVFMEGSPSCGVYRTSLKNKRLGHPPGIFGSLLLSRGFFLIPAQDMQSPLRWWDWRRRMFAWVWLESRDFSDQKTGSSVVVESWHVLKFLCQELSRSKADGIGRRIAAVNTLDAAARESLKTEVLDLLRTPSEPRKIKQSLWKNYVFLRKRFALENQSVLMPTDERGVLAVARECLSLEILASREGVLFGSSPVRYRRRDEAASSGADEADPEATEFSGDVPESVED